MECGFCKRQVPPGTTECPYCHYRFEIDAKVLTPEERDTFAGDTIDDDGNIDGQRKVYRNNEGYKGTSGQGEDNGNAGFIKVHNFGCGGSMFITLLLLILFLALVVCMLPTILVFAAIGAAAVFILRLIF